MNFDLTPGKRVGRAAVQSTSDRIRQALTNASVADLVSDQPDEFRCGQIDYAVQQLLVLQSYAHAQRAVNQARKVLP